MFLSSAQKEHMEGVVAATHGRRGFDRLALGATTDRVIRKATCPVLVVSNPSHQALATGPSGRHRLRRILYCTDLSNNSERTCGEAISLAAGVWRRFGGGRGDYSRTYTRTRKLVSETEPNKLPVRAAARFRKPDEEIVGTRLKRKQVS